jgi:hypothetical protein
VLLANLPRYCFEPAGVARNQNEVRAVLGEDQRELAPDARRSSGD